MPIESHNPCTPVEQSRSCRAVSYIRVARARDDDMTAVARQREECQRIAARYGMTVVREYADIGRPARLEHQTNLQRLLDDLARLHDAAFVAVYDYARLSRNLIQLEFIIRHIHAYGAEIATITGMDAAQRLIHEGSLPDEPTELKRMRQW